MEFNYYTIIIGIMISLIVFFKLPKLKKANTDTHLKISVIIPARNEEDNLPAILGDLKKQSYNIHEIICVDDNSTDATAQIIQEYDAKYIKLEGLQKDGKESHGPVSKARRQQQVRSLFFWMPTSA